MQAFRCVRLNPTRLNANPFTSAKPRSSMAASAAKNPPYATEKWWNQGTTAVVTGANKGIGLEIARELARAGVTVVVTARNEKSGLQARDLVEKAAEEAGSEACIFFQQLDITSLESVDLLSTWVQDYVGGIDILVNNAGFAYKGNVFGAEEARTTLATNYQGTADVCEYLAPLIREGGRIVNVSSMAGYTRIIKDDKLRERWMAAANKGELDELCDKFVENIKAGRHTQEGWPSSMYGVSKLALSMYTRALSTAELFTDRKVMVNACCPGYCSTDMSSHRGTKTALQGADTPVWLALRPPQDYVTGCMFTDRQQVPWSGP